MKNKFFNIILFISFISLNSFLLVEDIEYETNENKSNSHSKKKYYLSVCAIFRDEARFLKEWIEFHRLVGVDHFYLLNNLSQDDYITVLKPYIDQKIVELYQWNFETTDPSNWSPIQTGGYNMIIKKSAKETEWLAIIDTDEFLFPTKENNLKTFLNKYAKFSGVCVNWQMFGTSGVNHISDEELLIEMLTLRAPVNHSENIHVKSIVKPAHVKKCINPHFCIFYPGYFQVNEDMIRFDGPFSPYISINKIRINHYWARDEDFFYNIKIARRQGFGEAAEGSIQRNNNLNKEPDDTIFRFADELRGRMFN